MPSLTQDQCNELACERWDYFYESDSELDPEQRAYLTALYLAHIMFGPRS